MKNWPMRDDVCVCVCEREREREREREIGGVGGEMVVWKCCPLQCLLDIRTSIAVL